MKTSVVIIAISFLCGVAHGFVPSCNPPRRTTWTVTGGAGGRKKTSTKKKNRQELQAWSPFNKKDSPSTSSTVEVLGTGSAIPGDNGEELAPGPLTWKNALAGTVWLMLITWAFGFAPGTLGNDADTEMVKTLISQPIPRPDSINELWFAVWNSFAVVPAILAALTAPSGGQQQRLPASPFLWGSVAFGYFALGPYFATRTEMSQPLRKSDLGWASRNIFENRLFGIVLAAISLSIPLTSDLLVPGFDLMATASDYVSLFSESRFVAVASVDIALMSILSAILVAEDSARRGWESKSSALLIGMILLPVIGPSLYLASRPSLED